MTRPRSDFESTVGIIVWAVCGLIALAWAVSMCK
jgi:hypothetical protein